MDKTCTDCDSPVKKGPLCKTCAIRRYWATRRTPSRPCKTCKQPIESRTRTKAIYCSRACKFADPEMRARMGAPRNRVTKTCPGCGSEFSVPISNGPRYTYCSRGCSNVSRGRSGACARCGAHFRHSQTQRRKYCSEVCRRPPVLITCGHCATEFRVTPSRENRSRFCSARCYRTSGGETSIERTVRLVLEDLGVKHEQEAPIGPWVVDFLIEGRLVIEADGTYWHSLRPDVDKRKTDDLIDRGYDVWRLPETYIRRSDFPRRLRRKWERYASGH